METCLDGPVRCRLMRIPGRLLRFCGIDSAAQHAPPTMPLPAQLLQMGQAMGLALFYPSQIHHVWHAASPRLPHASLTAPALQVAGAGVNSANATCVDTKPQGGLTFVSRSATDSGYQPFISGNATTISFYVKQTASGSSSIGAASGATIPPSIQLGLGDDDTVLACSRCKCS